MTNERYIPNSPLKQAIIAKNADRLKIILADTKPEQLEEIDAAGQTLVHWVCAQSDPDLFTLVHQQLLKAKKTHLLLAKDNEGNTPVAIAAGVNSYYVLWNLLGALGDEAFDAVKIVNDKGVQLLTLPLEPMTRIILELFSFQHSMGPLSEKLQIDKILQRYPDANPELRKNLTLGCQLVNDAREVIEFSTTHPAANRYEIEFIKDALSKIESVRARMLAEEKTMIANPSVKSDVVLGMKYKYIKANKLGNCYEFSLAQAHLANAASIKTGSRFYLDKGDHEFFTLGMDLKSEYKTWSESAVVADGYDDVFPAYEIPKRLKYHFDYKLKNKNIVGPVNLRFHAMRLTDDDAKAEFEDKLAVVQEFKGRPTGELLLDHGVVNILSDLGGLKDFLKFITFLSKINDNKLLPELMSKCQDNVNLFNKICCFHDRIKLKPTDENINMLNYFLMHIKPDFQKIFLISTDKDQQTLLHLVADKPDYLKKILQYVDEEKTPEFAKKLLHLKDNANHTILDCAIISNNSESVKIVLQFYLKALGAKDFKFLLLNRQLSKLQLPFFNNSNQHPPMQIFNLACESQNLTAINLLFEIFKQDKSMKNQIEQDIQRIFINLVSSGKESSVVVMKFLLVNNLIKKETLERSSKVNIPALGKEDKLALLASATSSIGKEFKKAF